MNVENIQTPAYVFDVDRLIYRIRKIKGFYNKLLIIILWIPGKMKTKRTFKYIENVKIKC